MPTNVDIEGLQQLAQQGARVVDLLTPEEYDEEHVPGAINIPFKRLNRATTAALPRDASVVLYCYDFE